VPSVAILIVGVSITCTVFAYMRLKAAFNIGRNMNPLPISTIRLLTDADYPSVADISASTNSGGCRATEAAEAGEEMVAKIDIDTPLPISTKTDTGPS
jgi:hypothetical protein